MSGNYPDRQSTTDDSKKLGDNYPEDSYYCRTEGKYGCDCRYIEHLKKRIDDLEKKIEKLREYLSTRVQAEDPEIADHFNW